MASLKTKIPEDAFYQNPFGIDEGDDVEMADDDHDMFCTFGYFRTRFTVTTAVDGDFVYQWCPQMSYGSIRSATTAGPFTAGYPEWESYLIDNFSHFRICGAGAKFVPTMSQDTSAGEIVAGMYYPPILDPRGLVGADYPFYWQPSGQDSLDGDPQGAISELRGRRGVVEGSASSGLMVNWRHMKMFNFNWNASVQPDNGAAPAGGLGTWNFCTMDTSTFYPTSISGVMPFYRTSDTGVYTSQTFYEYFPSLLLCGTGLPASTNVGVLELVLGVCGVAKSSRVPSRTPKTVFLGSSVTDDAMSNVPPQRDALRKALTERAEQRGAKIWKTLDVASSVMRSLAPLGFMVNPAIGGAIGGASVAASALSTNLRNFYSS